MRHLAMLGARAAGLVLDAIHGAAMKDEKTVTARHTLQSLWRVGLAGPKQKVMVLDALEARFRECAQEKNGTLVRTDVVTALGRLSKAAGGETIEARVSALIDAEWKGTEEQRRGLGSVERVG